MAGSGTGLEAGKSAVTRMSFPLSGSVAREAPARVWSPSWPVPRPSAIWDQSLPSQAQASWSWVQPPVVLTVPDDPLPIEQPLPPLPPSRTTPWLCGPQAISAPYRAGGLSAGAASDQTEPSQNQVSASGCLAALVPPNMTTSSVAGS